ncbi:hypothetical protein [Sphingosinicella sp.]|uniref:hypothetical protein n=1 Tax=Sphingosinicella sp. TaxID=1917971 RepID=UPI00403832FA
MASEPDPAGAAPPPASPAPPAASGGGLYNLARGAKGVALLLFLIPWVTVSCGGTEFASMSGLDLATGSIDVRNPMTGQTESPPPGSGGGRGSDMWIIAAAGLIVAGLVLTFVLPRVIAALLAAVGSLGAAGLIGYTVLARLPAELREQPMAPPGGAGGGGAADMGMNAQQMAELIRVEPQLGFWLVMAALTAAAALNMMARGRAGP